MIDVSALAPWIAMAISILAIFLPYITGRSKELDKKLDEKAGAIPFGALVAKVDLLEDRTTRIEADFKHLPDHHTVNKLESAIAALSKDVGVLSERVKPIGAMADRIQEALLEKVGL